MRYFGDKCFDKKHCQFRELFFDAAGAFVAEWLIVDAVAIRSVLTGSNPAHTSLSTSTIAAKTHKYPV